MLVTDTVKFHKKEGERERERERKTESGKKRQREKEILCRCCFQCRKGCHLETEEREMTERQTDNQTDR
jgi:hypothetical protein